jgi:hypothetical protein
MLKVMGKPINLHIYEGRLELLEGWLELFVGARGVAVQELADGSAEVEFEFYPSRPFLGKHTTIKFHICREAIAKYGLVDNLIALAAHIKDVQRAYEQKERGFSSYGI